MRLILSSLIILCVLLGNTSQAAAKDPKPEKKERKGSTLSELGIDFGAAELGRFAELDLTSKQKAKALTVVRDRKPQIEKLCARMTKALKLSEATLEKKQAKETELAAILTQFKSIQSQIITGLHALVTPEQKRKLEAIKRKEQRKQKLPPNA